MELDVWLAKIKQARSHREIFAILDDFRKLDWADDQRSKMAKLYIRMLENFAPDSGEADTSGATVAPAASGAKKSGQPAAATAAKGTAVADVAPQAVLPVPEEDGPVWYEKM